MKTQEVTVVRIYLSEAEAHLDNLLKRLHGWEKVRGVTVFRGISGFGSSGEVHTSKLIDLSLDLPVVVEFFDTSDKAAAIIEHLRPTVRPGHIIHWTARMNMEE